MAESSPNGQKTVWEKEKLLITSIFSFSHGVFKRPVLQTRKHQGLFGKGLTLWQTSPSFDDQGRQACRDSLLVSVFSS